MVDSLTFTTTSLIVMVMWFCIDFLYLREKEYKDKEMAENIRILVTLLVSLPGLLVYFVGMSKIDTLVGRYDIAHIEDTKPAGKESITGTVSDDDKQIVAFLKEKDSRVFNYIDEDGNIQKTDRFRTRIIHDSDAEKIYRLHSEWGIWYNDWYIVYVK